MRKRKTDEREKLRTEHRARRNNCVQTEGRALENSHEVGCRSGPGEPGAENKTAAQKKVFRTLKSEEQKAPSEGRWKLLPRVRLNGRSRRSRNHLLQRRSHEVSSCPFNQLLRTSWLRLQPSPKSNQPLQSTDPEKSCQASQKEFFRRSRKVRKKTSFKPFRESDHSLPTKVWSAASLPSWWRYGRGDARRPQACQYPRARAPRSTAPEPARAPHLETRS